MPLPRGDEYQLAVQTPRRSFNDTELQSCLVETTLLGLPKPYAGGFTTTYHFSTQSWTHSRHWAVRCFTRQVADLHQRYRAIGRFIKKNNCRYFVQADCLLQGIRVNSQWLPVIKMQWVEGLPLNIYVGQNLASPERIHRLGEKFKSMVSEINALGIAHGDLQHGNILVKNDELFLIDYDGIFLPEIKRFGSNEIGHPNYQHPGRDERCFDQDLDRFSAIVIYLGLVATAAEPELWEQYEDGENILFRKEDFQNPANSPLISSLGKIQAIAELTQRFMGVCKLDYEKIPDLETFISGKFNYPKVNFSSNVLERPKLRFEPMPGFRRTETSLNLKAGRAGPANSRYSRMEKEALDRLYGQISPGSARNKSKTRPTTQPVIRAAGSGIMISSPSQLQLQLDRIAASPVYVWLRAVFSFIASIANMLAKGFAYLFMYNRPRQFTRSSLKRVSLFLFYALCAVAVLLLVAWLANVFA